jgi:hypothetical protein
MSKTTVASTGIDLSDNFAFTGTVSGAGGTYNLISTTDATSASSVSFTNLSGTGTNIIHVKNLYDSSDSDFRFRFITSGGEVTDSNYEFAQAMRSTSNSGTVGTSTSADYGQIFNAIDDNGNGENIRSSCTIYIPKVDSGNNPTLYGVGYQQAHNGNKNTVKFASIQTNTTAVVTGIKLFPGSGNFAQITASLYGVDE